MRNFIVPAGFAATVLAITWITAQAECKEAAIVKNAQNAALRSTLQHEANLGHPTGQVRAAEEQWINKVTHKGVAPVTPGIARKEGIVETPGMAKKGVAGTPGFKKKSMELLKEEENKGVNKLIDEGTSGMRRKGW
jgi:hypothetical protein